MASIREQILNGTYKPQYPQTSKQPTSKPILPTKKEDKKKGNIFSAIKTLPTSIAEGFGDAIRTVDRFAEEKLLLPIKASLSKKTYSELLEENRKRNVEQKDPLHEAKVVAEYAKQKYGESSKKYNEITSNLTQEKKVNPLNMKYTDTDTYKRKEAGELSKAEKTAYKIGGMAGGLLPTIGATMLTGNPLVGKAMFGAKAQQGYTEKALSEGKSELESNIYGTIMGSAELATEAIGFNPFKTTIPTGTKGILKDIFKSAIGEGIEEGLMEYVDSTVRSVGFKEKFDLKETTKEATESFIYGAVLGAIMDASQRGIASAVNVTNKIENNETPTKAEVEKAINDYKNAQPYAFKESVDEGLNKFKTNFEQDLNKLKETTPYDFMEKNLPQDPTREQSYDFLPQQSNDKAQVLTDTPKTETNILDTFQRDKMTLGESKDTLLQKLVNKGHYIDQLAKTTGNKDLTYKYDRMIGANAEGQYVIGTAQTNNEGKIIGKSINEIWKPVEDSGLVQPFSEYLLHKHNIDRAKQGKFIFGKEVTSEMSAKTASDLEAQYPQFIEWAKDINTFNKNELQNMQEAGLTTKETQEYLNATYDNYVRVNRNIESLPIDQKGKKTRVNSPLKRATGGNADILPLKDSMAEQVIKTKRAIRRNDLGLELMNELQNSNKAEDFDMDNIVRQDQDGAVFTVFKDGEVHDLKISPELYESLKPSVRGKLEQTLPLKVVQKLSQVQRSLLTVDNPLFIATNFFKDIGDAPFNSKYPTKFFQNYAKAVSEYKNKGNYYQEYMGNGGESNSYFDYEKGVKKAPKGVGKFIEQIRSANEAIEQYPRLAEYISTREAGGSILEAMYNSAEVTTNFKRGGDITKAINRNGVNFLNASVQGLSKQYRNLTGVNGIKGYTNLLLKATMFGIAPSVLNHLLLKDDEDYKDLSASQKDLYYLFKTGEGKFVRIPKGRAISIFGATARRSLESAEGEEDAFKGLGKHAFNQLAPNNPLEDNIGAPISQALKNKTWYGGDIVPLRLQNQLPKNQFDESTDMLSKFLGQNLNISPKKINYVLDQYSGGIGDVLLPMMTPQARSNPLSSKFTTDSVLYNKNVGNFFETVEHQQKIANDTNASETDILKSKYLNSVRAETNDLYKEKRQIQMSDLSNKEKKEKLREIQAEINAILEDGLKGYKDVEEYSNYSRVADREYFKNSKNEWQRVDDKEVSEISKLNFNENNYFKTKLEISKIKSNEKFSSEERKGKIIDTILKTKFTDEQKGYLYSKTYADTSNLIKANIPIDIYLKLQQQIKDIKSIDDPNSNISGKIISGSKKEQIVQQIQKLQTTRINKLMLYAMEGYALTSREKSEIFNHIDKLKITKKEKESIIKSMSNFQWLKNGQLKGW